MDREPLLGEIRDRLQAAYGPRLRGVVLYGSEARGQAAAGSDVDVLVLLDEVPSHLREARTCAAALLDVSIRLGRPIHAKPAPRHLYDRGASPLYAHVRREGVVV